MFGMVPFRRNNRMARKDDYFNDLFDSFFGDDFFDMKPDLGHFRVDVKEKDNKYEITADIPGVKKEDINVEYDNNYLTISAKRDEVTQDERDSYLRRERRTGQFSRSFYVDDADADNIDATFENGVLRMTIPKLGKKSGGRQINIK